MIASSGVSPTPNIAVPSRVIAANLIVSSLLSGSVVLRMIDNSGAVVLRGVEQSGGGAHS